jgi:hypothetical protein
MLLANGLVLLFLFLLLNYLHQTSVDGL